MNRRRGAGHSIAPASKPAGSRNASCVASPESPGLRQYVCQCGSCRMRSPSRAGCPGASAAFSDTSSTSTASTRTGPTRPSATTAAPPAPPCTCTCACASCGATAPASESAARHVAASQQRSVERSVIGVSGCGSRHATGTPPPPPGTPRRGVFIYHLAMDQDVDQLGERVERMLELVRRLADENANLRDQLEASRSANQQLQQRIAEARARVESALARLPLPADSAE